MANGLIIERKNLQAIDKKGTTQIKRTKKEKKTLLEVNSFNKSCIKELCCWPNITQKVPHPFEFDDQNLNFLKLFQKPI